MHPDSEFDTYNRLPPPRRKIILSRRQWLIAAGLSALVLAALFVFISNSSVIKADFQQRVLTDSGLTAGQNFGRLQGTTLYAYNGLSFYAVDTTNNKNAVLNSGLKLPTPMEVYWANESGALLTFKESFTLSRVEQAINSLGSDLNDTTRAYAWYLDFKTSQLRLATTSPIVTGLATYVDGKKGFYYITKTQNASSLYFYSPTTGKTTMVNKNLGLADIRDIEPCPGMQVCLIAGSTSKPGYQILYGVSQDGKLNNLYDPKGLLSPTSREGQYLVVIPAEQPGSEGHTEDESAAISDEPGFVYDAVKKTSSPLGIKIQSATSAMHILSDDTFYLFDGPGEESDFKPHYIAGILRGSRNAQSQSFDLTLKDGKTLDDDTILALSGSGNDNLALLETFKGKQLFFGPAAKLPPTGIPSQRAAEQAVKTCAQQKSSSIQYFNDARLFKVFFTQDASYNNNIKSFSDCLTQLNNAPIFGYNYYFGAIDPINGRIVSD